MAIKGFNDIKGVGKVIDNYSDTSGGSLTANQEIVVNEIVGGAQYADQILADFDLEQYSIINNINKILNQHLMNIAFNRGLSLDKHIDVSDLPDNYRFQGYTITDNYVYITAHDHDHEKPSVMLVYNHDGDYLGKVFLPIGAGGDAHVGGVSYDSIHNILYITGRNGDVLVLDNELIEDAIKIQSKNSNGSFSFNMEDYDYFRIEDLIINNQDINLFNSVPEEIQEYLRTTSDNLNAASVYYDEETKKLYIPTFSAHSKVYVFDVEFDKNGKPIYKYDKIYGVNDVTSSKVDDVDLPPAIQGVAIYNDEKGDHYLLTVSSHSSRDSVLVKYKINEDGSLTFSGQKVLEDIKGAENMTINGNDVYINVENDVSGSHHQDGGTFYRFDIIHDIDGSIEDDKYLHAIEKLDSSASNYDNKDNDRR